MRGFSRGWIETAALILGVLLVLVTFESDRSKARPEKEVSLIPPAQIKHFSFGYHELAADLLWLRVIQDIDRCGKSFEVSSSADTEPRCRKGWTFHYLDSITELTPRFRAPYLYGAPALSVLVNDREGASLLFEKGLQNYPNDWKILLSAAYHFLFETHDEKRAAELLVRAGREGAPKWVFALAARLYTNGGQAFLAKIILTDALKLVENEPESKSALRIRQRLLEVEQTLRSAHPDKAGAVNE